MNSANTIARIFSHTHGEQNIYCVLKPILNTAFIYITATPIILVHFHNSAVKIDNLIRYTLIKQQQY